MPMPSLVYALVYQPRQRKPEGLMSELQALAGAFAQPALASIRASLRTVVAAFCWCAIPATGALASGANSVPDISAVTLEKNCSGCTDGYTMRLQNDGVALLTRTGHARLGTQDERLRGTVAAADFNALARLLLSRGYFAMDDVYEDPQTRDGSWSTISVERGGAVKKVFSRDGAGPEGLHSLLRALEQLQSRTPFKAIP